MFRFLQFSSAVSQAHCQCATASRPLAPKTVRTLRRRPKGLSVLVLRPGTAINRSNPAESSNMFCKKHKKDVNIVRSLRKDLWRWNASRTLKAAFFCRFALTTFAFLSGQLRQILNNKNICSLLMSCTLFLDNFRFLDWPCIMHPRLCRVDPCRSV